MSSVVYDNFLNDILTGSYDVTGATFNCLLVNGYSPSKGTDHYRSDVDTFEVTGSAGYTGGGQAVACTMTLNPTTHQLTLAFASPSWASSSIAATGAVIYHSRGGSDTADELVAYLDFGGLETSVNNTFTVTIGNPLTIQL